MSYECAKFPPPFNVYTKVSRRILTGLPSSSVCAAVLNMYIQKQKLGRPQHLQFPGTTHHTSSTPPPLTQTRVGAEEEGRGGGREGGRGGGRDTGWQVPGTCNSTFTQ